MRRKKNNIPNWIGISELKRIQLSITGKYNPSPRRVLRAFRELSPRDVKVVILGQDPYPEVGKASGLAFGLSKEYIRKDKKLNSSIANIVEELHRCGYSNMGRVRESLTLAHWVKQGVLLVNTSLTVEPGKPMSHRHIWGNTVMQVLEKNLDLDRVVFLCWGREALDAARSIGAPYIVATSHPCKFSHRRETEELAAFTGSRCFDLVNMYLPNATSKIYWGILG